MSVYKAIAAVMGELAQTGISKSRRNQQQNYSFRGIDDVYNALAPIMAKHGIAVVQAPHNEAGGVAVTTRLIHSSGEWIQETLILPVETTKTLSVAQASGVVITYARRYSLAAMLGIAQEDTDAAKPDKAWRQTGTGGSSLEPPEQRRPTQGEGRRQKQPAEIAGEPGEPSAKGPGQGPGQARHGRSRGREAPRTPASLRAAPAALGG